MAPMRINLLNVEATHEPERSAGVPPASSPSVSLDEGPGGGTPPELAAVDGRPTPYHFMESSNLQEWTRIGTMNLGGTSYTSP